MKRATPMMCVIGLLLLAVVAGSCAGASPAPSGSPAPPPSAQPGDVISWGEAASSIGQTLTVEGPVASLKKGRGPQGPAMLLSIGADPSDPQRFVIVIPNAVLKRLSADERQRLAGALVRVTGTIVKYEGAATIVVESPRQLRLR